MGLYWSFGPKWTQIIHLPLQAIFLKKTDCYFCLLKYLITILQCLKKIIKVDHKIQGCMTFGQTGQRHFFRGKLSVITFVNLLCAILIKCLNFKNRYRESWDKRFCNFGQHWDQIAEFSLLGQGIRGNTVIAKYLVILSPTTRNNPPFVDSPTKYLSLSIKYQLPCFNPVKTFLAF